MVSLRLKQLTPRRVVDFGARYDVLPRAEPGRAFRDVFGRSAASGEEGSDNGKLEDQGAGKAGIYLPRRFPGETFTDQEASAPAHESIPFSVRVQLVVYGPHVRHVST